MPIYTRKGDKGKTSLLGGVKIKKTDKIIEAIGSIDELNAVLGVVLSQIKKDDFKDLQITLRLVQDRIFYIGSAIASNWTIVSPHPSEADITLLEKAIDKHDKVMPPLKHFILPGGHPVAALLQQARSVCRRAERAYFRVGSQDLNGKFLNRLSDFLFSSARFVNYQTQTKETQWIFKK